MAKININREQIEQFLLKNKKQVIIGGILLVVVIIALAVLFKLNHDFINQTKGGEEQQQTGSETVDNPDPGAVSTYLPDTSRRIEDNREVRDPFSRGMMLKGIITSGSGGNLAIIESGSTAFVTGPGDEIAGGWTVTEIKHSVVILKMGIHKLQLEFNGRVRDLTPSAAPDKTAIGQPATGETAAEQGKTGAAGPTNVPVTGDNSVDEEASRDTMEQSTAQVPGATSSPASRAETLSQDGQATGNGNNQPFKQAGKEGVQDDR